MVKMDNNRNVQYPSGICYDNQYYAHIVKQWLSYMLLPWLGDTILDDLLLVHAMRVPDTQGVHFAIDGFTDSRETSLS